MGTEQILGIAAIGIGGVIFIALMIYFGARENAGRDPLQERLAEYGMRDEMPKSLEELEQQLAGIDSELLKAKSIVRRMVREQAELTQQEMESLALQLRQAEERTDGRPLPVTAIDVDAAVDKALKGSAGQLTPKNPK